MPDLEPWANLNDLKARWPALPSDQEGLAQLLLEDATHYIRDAYPSAVEASEHARKRVVCSLAQRSLQSQAADAAPFVGGVEQFQMSAGPFSQSFKPLNPSGDFYLTRQEKAALGINRMRAGSVDLLAGRDNDYR